MPGPLAGYRVIELAGLGPGPFGAYKSLLESFPGKLVMFALTFSIFFHLANGVRHLAWDMGKGFEPRTADMTAAAALAFAVTASVAVFVLAAFTGAL